MMPRHSTRGHGRILRRQPTESNNQLGVLGDDRLGGGIREDPSRIPQNIGQQNLRGTVAVGVDAAHISAQTVEEAMNLALGVMKPAGTGPTIGPPVHRLRPVLAVDPPQLTGQQIQRGLPGHRHERIIAAPRRARTPIQPAPAHIRLRDPGRMMLRGGDIIDQRHRFWIPAPRPHLDQPRAVTDRFERPPVRQMRPHEPMHA
jgi:hypothetical protein